MIFHVILFYFSVLINSENTYDVNLCRENSFQRHVFKYTPNRKGVQEDRAYYVYLPPSFCEPSAEPIPYLFLIHGFTNQPTIYYYQAKVWESSLPVIMPHGYANSWNGDFCCGEALKEHRDEVRFFYTVLENVKVTYSHLRFDERRIYVSGFSNGGFLTSKLAKIPLVNKAFAMHGSTYHLPKPGQVVPTSIAFAWGEIDFVVPYGGCCDQICCCDISHSECVDWKSIFHSWKEVNECETFQEEKTSDRDALCLVGVNCRRNTRSCLYHGLDHESLTIMEVINFFNS